MKKIVFAGIVALLLAACAKSTDPVNNVAQAANDKDIQSKNFVSDCKAKAFDGGLTGIISIGSPIQSALVGYRIDGARISRTSRLFTTNDCSGDTAISFEETGTVSIQPDKRTSDLGKFIDVDYTKLEVATPIAAGVTAANALHLCGATNWDVSASRDVTDRAKDPLCYGVVVPRHLATIYRFDAGNLYWGATDNTGANASDNNHRPSTINFNDKYKAQ